MAAKQECYDAGVKLIHAWGGHITGDESAFDHYRIKWEPGIEACAILARYGRVVFGKYMGSEAFMKCCEDAMAALAESASIRLYVQLEAKKAYDQAEMSEGS